VVQCRMSAAVQALLRWCNANVTLLSRIAYLIPVLALLVAIVLYVYHIAYRNPRIMQQYFAAQGVGVCPIQPFIGDTGDLTRDDIVTVRWLVRSVVRCVCNLAVYMHSSIEIG